MRRSAQDKGDDNDNEDAKEGVDALLQWRGVWVASWSHREKRRRLKRETESPTVVSVVSYLAVKKWQKSELERSKMRGTKGTG